MYTLDLHMMSIGTSHTQAYTHAYMLTQSVVDVPGVTDLSVENREIVLAALSEASRKEPPKRGRKKPKAPVEDQENVPNVENPTQIDETNPDIAVTEMKKKKRKGSPASKRGDGEGDGKPKQKRGRRRVK